MGFEDIERILRKFFGKAKKTQRLPSTLKEEVLQQYREKYVTPPRSGWERLFEKRSLIAALCGFGLLFILNIFPGSYAGKVEPIFGPVEIVRGEKVILVQVPTKLNVGDIVRVGNNAEAKVVFPEFISTAGNRTQFRVTSRNSLFLENGALKNQVARNAEITTDRGIISGPAGALFDVWVSETGETKVVLTENSLSVFDWNDGEKILNPGEEIILRTDTLLTEKNLPSDISLSLDQILAICSKLVIARTKIVTGLEKMREDDYKSANRDIDSAKRTFRSLVQVLETTRDLQITERKNLDLIALSEVSDKLAQKTNDQKLIAETRAIEELFSLVDVYRDRVAFGGSLTGVSAYDRFVLLNHVFSLGTEKQQFFGNILKQKYVIAFLQKIQNEELRIDQISQLNEYVSLLPKNEISREFLVHLKNLLSPNMAGILEEKIEQVF